MEHARVERAVRNQSTATLFRNTDKLLLRRLRIEVAKMDIEEFHSADLFELFLDPAASLKGILDASPDGVLVKLLIWIQQLEKARNCMPDSNRIPLVQV